MWGVQGDSCCFGEWIDPGVAGLGLRAFPFEMGADC